MNIDLLNTIEQIQYKFYLHVNNMFDVIKEIEGVRERKRTGSLGSDKIWTKIVNLYKNSDNDFQTLLLLGIIYHDISKPIQFISHAKSSHILMQPFDFEKYIKNTEITRSNSGWNDNYTINDANHILQYIILYHEILGNYFTGEQSLIGFLPILNYLPTYLLNDFMDILILLTISEVGSYGEHGFLAEYKCKRYFEARNEILKIVTTGKPYYNELFKHSKSKSQIIKRLLGLCYAFSSELSTLVTSYRSSVEIAIKHLYDKHFVSTSFYDNLGRIVKFSYGLEWLSILSGGKTPPEGMPKSVDDIMPMILFIRLLLEPVKVFKKGSIFEYIFPSSINVNKCKKHFQYLKNSINKDDTAILNNDINIEEFLKRKIFYLWPKGPAIRYSGVNDNGIQLIEIFF